MAAPPTLPPSIGDDARLGFWSPRTASVNWCEPDYLWSPYVAEFWNTASSVVVVLGGLLGLVLSLRYGLRRRFALGWACMVVVGVGSVAFHGTLRREGQALDELPMVFGTQAFTFVAVEAAYGGFGARPRFRWLAPLLTAYCVAFAAAYLLLGEAAFLFFVGLYIGGVVLLVALSVGLYKRLSVTAQRVGILSNCVYAGGFLLLWLPDNFLCSRVQPYSFHAWFHLTSTLGPFLGFMFLTFAHYQLAFEADAAAAPRPELAFAAGCLPYVVLVRGGGGGGGGGGGAAGKAVEAEASLLSASASSAAAAVSVVAPSATAAAAQAARAKPRAPKAAQD